MFLVLHCHLITSNTCKQRIGESNWVGYYNIAWRSKNSEKKFFICYRVCTAECLLFRERSWARSAWSISEGKKEERFLRLLSWCGWTADRIPYITPSKWPSSTWYCWQYNTSTWHQSTTIPWKRQQKMKCVVCNTKRIKTGVDRRHECRIKCLATLSNIFMHTQGQRPFY